ncbi:alpha/beta hydrolase [Rapidithrix thailandica]|uniref:Alpha/beta hydrolase n=1 Tax=Rapidithrix thailandica TaxID=413964 RepID=A0AAW9SGW1_9BACT
MHSKFFSLLFLILVSGISQAQQTEETLVTYTNYLLYVPSQKPASGKYPLLLFLHGSGERGEDLEKVKTHGPPSFLNDSTDFPFVVVSPQCPEGQRWNIPLLLRLLDQIEQKLPIDTDREYVTGLSMGGFGTWELAQAAPSRFAAIAPICGGGDSTRLCVMKHVPTWVFHGGKDQVVPPAYSEKMVKGLRALGAEVKYTLYPELYHDSWSITYANPELYKWLLQHKRGHNSYALGKDFLQLYEGVYQYSASENLLINLEGNSLYITPPGSSQKILIEPFAMHQFRTADKSFAGQNELYFKLDKKGTVVGLTIGPCDLTYCEKNIRSAK